MLHAVIFVSLVVAVAPIVAMLFFIWWVDRYDREPLSHVFLSFLWGAVGAFILSLVGSEIGLRFFGEMPPEMEAAIGAVVLAPIVEELMKGLILFFLVRHRNFDNVTDGLVYGAASGLGFGMTENFFYFIGTAGTISGEDWLNLLFVRSVFTAYMHSAATATFGAGISRLKNRGWRALTSVIFFYAVAVALHASWNALLSVGSKEAGGWAILILLFYFSLIFLLFTVGIRNERKQREKILEEEFESGVIPSEFKNSLFSYRTMRRNNWFPSHLNKENYLSLISRLAMRKSDYAKAGEKRRVVIDEEIAQIRQELKRYSDLISQIPK